jgi:hypothetical protein
MTWKLKRTKQCSKCPWKTSVDPHDIPDGYSVEKHEALESTIAKKCDIGSLSCATQQVMACHETDDAHCIGWLENQLGVGNNIALRISMMSCENAGEFQTFGEQHECFEDTLPT